jgi:hypothetical protein
MYLFFAKVNGWAGKAEGRSGYFWTAQKRKVFTGKMLVFHAAEQQAPRSTTDAFISLSCSQQLSTNDHWIRR